MQGGEEDANGVIYDTKHDLIYVGQTGNKLNERLNAHSSDIKLRPERSELDKHFHHNRCDFDHDLQVSILERV